MKLAININPLFTRRIATFAEAMAIAQSGATWTYASNGTFLYTPSGKYQTFRVQKHDRRHIGTHIVGGKRVNKYDPAYWEVAVFQFKKESVLALGLTFKHVIYRKNHYFTISSNFTL